MGHMDHSENRQQQTQQKTVNEEVMNPPSVNAELLQQVDPSVLEQKMLEKHEGAEAAGSPADIAAVFFQRNYPRMKTLMANMSKRGIERSMICAAAYPLVPKDLKPQNKEEHELAWVLEQMVTCKVLMIEQMKLDKLNSVDELKTEENLTLEKGKEQTNGEA